MGGSKSRKGNSCEDFPMGSLYLALTGSRDAVTSSCTVAADDGLARQPLDLFNVCPNLKDQNDVPAKAAGRFSAEAQA